MAANEISTRLDETVAALQGGVKQLGVNAALPVIQDWQERLEGSGSPDLAPIAENLGTLRTQLAAGDFDPAMVGQLLTTLGEQVQGVSSGVGAEVSDRLAQLGSLLGTEGGSLSS